MGAVGRTARWLFTPSRPAELESTETWPCPACGRDVEIIAPPHHVSVQGYWLPPAPLELRTVCARTHRAHRPDGGPLLVPEPRDPEVRWRPVAWVGTPVEGSGLRSFVVLVPPAGVAFEVDPEGASAYSVVVLRHLEPSVLAGSWHRSAAGGEVVGRVAAAEVPLDVQGDRVDWEAVVASSVGPVLAADVPVGP